MITIYADRAIELLREVVREQGEDTRYDAKYPGARQCKYTVHGAPACIIGHVIFKATGHLIPEDHSVNSVSVGAALNEYLYDHGVIITEEAQPVLLAAQGIQDTGDSWSAALHAAEDTYQRSAREMDK